MNTNLESRLSELDLPVPSGLAERALRAAAAPEVLVPPARRRVGAWRLALAAFGLAVTAVFALPSLRDGAEPVSAQEILARATGPAAGTSYHQVYIIGTVETSGAGSTGSESNPQLQRVEVWYRDAEHVRLEIRNVDASGTVGGLVAAQVRNGDEVWYLMEDGGTDNGPPILRITHGTVRSVPGSVSLGDILRLPNDFGSALEKYRGKCSSPSLKGESEVAGRTAYMLDVCGAKLWIDKSTYIVLRAEESEGSVVGKSEVLQFEADVAIPDAVFDYRPPAGAMVSEQPNPPPQDAHAILASVRAAAAAPKQPFHAVVKSGTPEQSYQTDMWYADEYHARSEEREYRAGKLFSTFGVSRNGAERWLYSIDQRQTNIIHETKRAGGSLPSVIGGNPWLAHSGIADITQFLENGLSPCRPATRWPDDVVNGRPTFVVAVESWIPGCKDPGITPAGGATEPEASVARTNWTLWFDQETYFPLKQESRFLSGAPVRPEWKWEVTVFEVGPVDPSAFDYRPPTGVKVKEVVGTP